MRRLIKSIKSYNKSKNLLAAPSTFSKGIDQFAYGISPYILTRGKGAYVWDIDNNKYIDTIMSLGAIILGHSNEQFNNCLIKQLKKGTTLSLTTELEIELAELIVKRIPCAEMVRFGKNGNDATTLAVRLSRHVTKKNNILFCGYHGWQDWYISKTSMNSGIPKEISNYSHRFTYNDIESLENLLINFKGDVACIILEPISKVEPICTVKCKHCKNHCDGFLKKVRWLADKHKVILIFDEVVTGFRWSIGGYQEVCGVTPDLACFSKAISNGLPLSVLAGKKDIMKKSDEIFYSLTFGGETLSLAAAIFTIKFLEKHNVCEKIQENGSFLLSKINKLIDDLKIGSYVQTLGFPAKNFFIFKDSKNISAEILRTYFVQEVAKNSILSAGYHIMSYSHDEKILNKLIAVYKKVFVNMKDYLENNSLQNKIKIPKPKLSAGAIL
jgi:glutamate-1-semialdehyde 2,1-aminomutase